MAFDGLLDSDVKPPWEDHGKDWRDNLLSRRERDLDTLIAITGMEGVGKSTAALHLATKMHPTQFGIDNIHFGTRSFIDQAGELPKGSCLVLDEAFDGGFNRDFMQSDTKGFVKFLGEGRALLHTMIICFPRYLNLDEYIRNHRVAYRIWIPRRGEARVYTQGSSPWERESEPSLESVWEFGSMEHHPIWPEYQEKKEERIRERASSDGSAGGPSGLTKGAIKKAAKKGYLDAETAIRELLQNGHMASEWAARLYLASYVSGIEAPDD